MKKISVIIVSWNTKKITLDCINSIYHSHCERENLEIIVVDNASTDGSVKAIEKAYPDVIIIRNQENLGFAKANNIGIKRAQGNYITFINSDVIVQNGCLDTLVSFLENTSKAGLCGPKILNKDLSYQLSVQKTPGIWNTFIEAIGIHNYFLTLPLLSGTFIKVESDKPRKVDILTGCFWMVRKNALREVGPLDESFFFYGEDKEWCIRFKRKGWENWYIPQANAIHLGGASSKSMPVDYYLHLQKAQLQLWMKFFSHPKLFFMKLNKMLYFWERLLIFNLKRISRRPLMEADRHKAVLHKKALQWLIGDTAHE